MKKSQRIPKKWDWYTCAMFVLTGIALIPTPWNEASQEARNLKHVVACFHHCFIINTSNL